jgi:hypothetical protein
MCLNSYSRGRLYLTISNTCFRIIYDCDFVTSSKCLCSLDCKIILSPHLVHLDVTGSPIDNCTTYSAVSLKLVQACHELASEELLLCYLQMSRTYTRSMQQLILSKRHCLQRISSVPDGCCRCFTLVYMFVPVVFTLYETSVRVHGRESDYQTCVVL